MQVIQASTRLLLCNSGHAVTAASTTAYVCASVKAAFPIASAGPQQQLAHTWRSESSATCRPRILPLRPPASNTALSRVDLL
jgi:hypothetical protein